MLYRNYMILYEKTMNFLECTRLFSTLKLDELQNMAFSEDEESKATS